MSDSAPSLALATGRRPELDGLRVLLIAGVFLHHVAMPFGGDPWYVGNADTSRVLDDVMVYFEQMRLPMLFFVSGAVSWILLLRTPRWTFVRKRLMRLLIPFAFAVLVVVPPQTYVESLPINVSYLEAYPHLFDEWRTHHLWFIEYLAWFVVLSLPMTWLLRRPAVAAWSDRWLTRPSGLLLLGGIGVLARVAGEWAEMDQTMFYFCFYIAGMVLVSRPNVWRSVGAHVRTFGWALAIVSMVFYAYYFPDLSAYASEGVRWTLWWLLGAVLAWTALLASLALAQHVLTRRRAWIESLNEMVYPFYILHQTVIVIAAYWVVQWSAGVVPKLLGLLAISLVVTVALCVGLIRPFRVMRFLFGAGGGRKRARVDEARVVV